MFIEYGRKFIVKHFVLLVCLLFVVVAFLAGQQEVSNLFRFTAVQLCFIYLPGYAFQQLCGVKYSDKLVKYFVSYATGYALSVVIYIGLLLLGIQHSVMYVYFLLALLSVIVVFKLPTKEGVVCFKEHVVVGVILFVAFMVAFVSFQCVNMSAKLIGGDVWYRPDLVFWMRNSVAAVKAYPLPELSVAGRPLFYHYFSSIELAFLSLTTRIEMFDLVFVYYYLVYMFLFVGGIYVVLKEIVQRQVMVYFGLCLILFTCSLERLTFIYFSTHIYVSTFGCVEGLAFMCYCLYYFFRFFKDSEKRGLLFFSLLMFFLCVGSKGPIAAVLLVAIGVGCAFIVFEQHDFKKGAIVGLSFLIVFLFVAVMFVFGYKSFSMESGSKGLSISIVDTLYRSKVYLVLCNKLTSIIGIYWIARMLSMLLFVCSFLLIPLLALALTLYLSRRCERNKYNRFCFILFGTLAIIGIVLCLFVSQAGMSQMYFAFPAIMAIELLACSRITYDVRHIGSLWCVLCVGMFLFGIQNGHFFADGIQKLMQSISIGKKSFYAKGMDKVSMGEEGGQTISWNEIEGLRWIRENLQEDILLLSNKILASGGSRSFLVSAFTERQAFFESYDYSGQNNSTIEQNLSVITDFYNGSQESLEMLRVRGVTHAVVFKRVFDNVYPKDCKKVFENEDLIVVSL